MRRTAILATILLLAGCDSGASSPATPAPSDSAEPVVAQSATTAQAPLAKLPAGRSEKVSNDLFEFEYAYPGAAGSIPELKALLDKRLAASRDELEKGAKSDQAEAKQSDYPYRQHSSGVTWQVVTNTPRWLSLSAQGYEYTGGAHGMTFFDALLWDRQETAPRKPADLFTSSAALSRAIRDPFCAALDKEREKRRGEPVNRDSGDSFDECIDPVESTIILGSSNGKTFDKIGVLVGPYAAGSYAEGTFDLTLPVTRAVLAAVKPEFRAGFSTKD